MILLLFCLLVAGAIILAALAYFYPHLTRETAVAEGVGIVASIMALALWLAMRPQLPLVVTLPQRPEAALLLPWNWRVDEVAWQLTGVVLLLPLAALLATSSRPQTFPSSNWPPGIYLLVLTAATLVTIWSDSPAGRLASWMLLAVVWTATLWLAGAARAEVAPWLFRAGWMLLGLFALWLGSAGDPGTALSPANTDSTVRTITLLLAAILQMGVWPLSAWRPAGNLGVTPAVAAMIYLFPTVAGSALLARLVANNPVSMNYALLLTALALLGFLRGLRLAWAYLQEPVALAAALALVQSSIILMAGIWAGPAAVIAEVRVLLLAVGMLFLMGGQRLTRARWWRAVGAVIVLAALAGLPLTAGFAGRAALYDAWLANGRFILVLVAALLHVPLTAAVLLLLWRLRETSRPVASEEVTSTGSALVGEGALILPALGLLSLAGMSQASLVSWLAVGGAAVAGFFLHRYVGEVREARAALRQAFTLNLPLQAAVTKARWMGRGIRTAVGEAVLILEGEGGLLWLLVLVVVFLLAL